jgi:glycosyltransferase involved in cell wall biosynthesis
MARLDDFLARWLLRRMRRDSGSPVAALEEYCARKDALIERLKDTNEKRANTHTELQNKHNALKDQFKALKETARQHKHQAWRWETECKQLEDRLLSLENSISDHLSRPGLPLRTREIMDREWSFHLRNHKKVWKHPMRLGVLRQHEPKPLERSSLPATTPRGDPVSWPLVSIVTPSYQQAAFLPRTMRSVLDQKYPRLEYFVMDGGSQDGSVALIEKEAPQLAGWASERDTGPASAVNRGFARARGEIMAWLNSDDLLMPGVVNQVAAYFSTHPEVEAVYGHRLIINERDQQVGHWVLPRHDPEMLLWADYIPQETLFWRRSLWERTGSHLDENFKFAFDWELLLRFQKARARIVRLPYFLGCFRVHDSQKSTADISTVGMAEMARLRERELGSDFNADTLTRKVVAYQKRAVTCDRLLRLGIRW